MFENYSTLFSGNLILKHYIIIKISKFSYDATLVYNVQTEFKIITILTHSVEKRTLSIIPQKDILILKNLTSCDLTHFQSVCAD